MSFRPRLGYPILFVLVALAIVAPLAFLLVAAYGDLHRQAETSARNVVNVLEARLEATLRRAQAGLEELAAETHWRPWKVPFHPLFSARSSSGWPCAPGIFRRSPDFA
jgi:hypothetical protein